jgi:hypothetical protein
MRGLSWLAQAWNAWAREKVPRADVVWLLRTGYNGLRVRFASVGSRTFVVTQRFRAEGAMAGGNTIGKADPCQQSHRRGRRRRRVAVLAALLACASAYVGSYYRLSRRGIAEAAAHEADGFLYVSWDSVMATEDLTTHNVLYVIYWPLNWIDGKFFGGKSPMTVDFRISGETHPPAEDGTTYALQEHAIPFTRRPTRVRTPVAGLFRP